MKTVPTRDMCRYLPRPPCSRRACLMTVRTGTPGWCQQWPPPPPSDTGQGQSQLHPLTCSLLNSSLHLHRELHQSWRGQNWHLMWLGACAGAAAGNQTEPWAVPVCLFFLAPGSSSAYACSSQVESRFVTALL